LPESGKIAATDETFLPGVAIDLRVTERWFFWPLVVLLLLVYACLGIAAGTDFDKLLAPLEAMKQLSTVQAMEKSLLTFGQNYWLFLKGAASFLQAIALLVLFGMLGKKIS
jgi:membrane-bound acyltransferase YfiQ involved in biofilm formation